MARDVAGESSLW